MNIILKCDDFWGKDWNQEKTFFDLIIKCGIKYRLELSDMGFQMPTKGQLII